MLRLTLCWIGLVVIGADLAGLAHAQGAQDYSARAEELFREGRQASARGDHKAACESYRESFRLESALGTLLNIAVCEEALGHLTAAFEHYQRVLPALPDGDTRVALTRDRLQALERRLPRVTILLMEGDRDTTRILIGSIEHQVASLSGPLAVDPGAHELRVLAKGHEPRSYSFAIAEGERRTIAVTPGEPIASPPDAAKAAPASSMPATPRPAPSRVVDDSGSTQRALGWTALAAGGAGLVTSAVAFGFVIDRKLTVDDHCDAGVCDPIGDSAAKSGRTLVTVSLVSLAAGGVAAAAGLYLLWSAPSDASSSTARVGLLVDRNLLGAQLVGAF